MKKDPLRDNRIFPEEMQQQPHTFVNDSTTHSVVRFVRVLMVLVLLGVIGFFVYQYLTTPTVPVDSVDNAEQQRYVEELEFFEHVQSLRPPLTPEERALRIEQLSVNISQ